MLAALSRAWAPAAGPAAPGLAWGPLRQVARAKATKTTSYRTPSRAGNTSRPMVNYSHIGVKALSAEYVETGRIVVKQRKYIAKNVNVTRRRHFKYYPGENIRVLRNTSLAAMVSGRVKYTHDVARDVLVANVMPEPREELLADDLWRYRTEHVECLEDNKLLVNLRQKAIPTFGKPLVNPPTGVRPAPKRVAGVCQGGDPWNNHLVQDPLEFVRRPYPLSGGLLRKHLRGALKEEDSPAAEQRAFPGGSAQR